jgi:hypothetical protein
LHARKGTSSHFHQHLRPLTFARAKYNRARTLRTGLRHGSTSTVCVALETEPTTIYFTGEQQRARGRNYRQGNQLLPIHQTKHNLKTAGRNR